MGIVGTLSEIIKEQWEWRKQILSLGLFDLKKTSAGAVLGSFWFFAKPAVYIFCFWFALEVGLKSGNQTGSDVPYILWLMGGLTYVTPSDTAFLAVPVLGGTAILFLMRWRINLLSFGTDEAESLGVPVKKYQGIIIVCATFMTAASVAVGGMIGWTGLIVPHFARMFAGPDYKKMLPCAAVLGAAFMLVVDDAARCLFPQELPIGILTAILGAPVFVALLAKGKRGFL